MRRREFLALLTAGATGALVGGNGHPTQAQTDAAREAGSMPTQAELDAMMQEWWETVRTDRSGEYVWDDEIKAVNALMDDVDEFPDWSLQVRGAMPRSGFEMCSHRWLDGLADVLTMLGEERHFDSPRGHCGDVPRWVQEAAMDRADAVEAWADGQVAGNMSGARVAGWLGDTNAQKVEAAHAFVELVRLGFAGGGAPLSAAAERWRWRADANPVVAAMFGHGEGLDGLLHSNCGYKIVDRLDIMIRIIGGDDSGAGDLPGVCCRRQIGMSLRDDPGRYYETLGILWGLESRLTDRDEGWLPGSKPEVADAAVRALGEVQQAGEMTPLRRWLIASMLKATKIWCEFALWDIGDASVPEYARDLPDVIAALRA